MIIKRIKLHNIRSYAQEEIVLPRGKVLLSGDIGSGKSTVLLAIEFALFGLQRGLVEGASLLRNGQSEGSVEVDFLIGGHNISIRRNLKRTKDSVTQSSAFLEIDGKRRELTATELKSFILEIMNYPPSLLNKKNLIYRYTVYTPQEEMKRIMLEDAEARLDTLRKVFDIDKYKRIVSNSEIFVAKLKENKKEKEGQLVDLPFKKEQLRKKEESEKELNKQIRKITPLLLKNQQDVTELRARARSEEANLEMLNKKKVRVAELDVQLQEKNSQIKALEKENEELDAEIRRLRNELKTPEREDNLAKRKNEEEVLLRNGRANEKILSRELAMLIVKKEKLMEDSKKISQLNFCPVCKQTVTPEHRNNIVKEIEIELEEINNELERKEPIVLELRQEIERLEKSMNEIVEKEKEILAYKLRLKNLQEKELRKLRILNSINEIAKKIGELEKNKAEEMEEMKKYKHVEEQHEKTIALLEEKQREERKIAMEKAGLEQALKDINQEIIELKKEIEKREEAKEKIIKLQHLQDFLTKNFSLIMEMMEKQVMIKLNAEFNILFKKWFSMLVDDATLEVRVDADFTPKVEQNGYEISYAYLSGGERTALALAYRLALNQVINSILSKLNTRNLLILDEPTDGFSSEQLDKMRDILNELKTEQLILVSHEPKIESFVEQIIRFTKQGHVSKCERS
ncbi:MAG: AAA family ATPase [Candidatus Pacearchaeota archaeon]|nr:AAA family ATPase [Candidatus Pacearchaeota archaeon]